EGFLLHRVQLAGYRFWLAMFHAQTMQQRDQAGPALVVDAPFPLDLRADLTGGAGQSFADPGFQFALLLRRQPAHTAFITKAGQTFDPVLLIQLVPGSDRVVVQKQHLGDGRAAHANVQQDQRVGSTGQAVRNGTVAGQLDQIAAGFAVEEARTDHAGSRIASLPVGKRQMRISDESEYIITAQPRDVMRQAWRALGGRRKACNRLTDEILIRASGAKGKTDLPHRSAGTFQVADYRSLSLLRGPLALKTRPMAQAGWRAPPGLVGGDTSGPIASSMRARSGRSRRTCPSSARRIASRCAGVVPQQPPMMRAPASTASLAYSA